MIMAAGYYFGLLPCYLYIRAALQIFRRSELAISVLNRLECVAKKFRKLV